MIGITDLVGYLATVVGTLLMLPQLIKSYKSKSMNDVSWGMVSMYVLNCLLWLIYGFLINSIPLMLCIFIALLIGIFQFYLKLKYK